MRTWASRDSAGILLSAPEVDVPDLLLSNDDGIDSGGLRALEAALASVGNCLTVAPATERSAQSHALTMHKPLRVREVAPGRFSVSGTPADCVYLALHHLCSARPALVVSGINRGGNLGNDVHYSGTVAAAREACLAGLPAIAVSLALSPGDRARCWETAGEVAARVARLVLAEPLPPFTLLNVNVPNVPLDQLKGIAATVLGPRHYAPQVEARHDPRGKPYYWIGGPHERFEAVPSSDGLAVEAGWASVSALPAFPNDLAVQRWLESRLPG